MVGTVGQRPKGRQENEEQHRIRPSKTSMFQHQLSTSWSSRGPPLLAAIIGNGAVINDVVLYIGPRSTWVVLVVVVVLTRCASTAYDNRVLSALRWQ